MSLPSTTSNTFTPSSPRCIHVWRVRSACMLYGAIDPSARTIALLLLYYSFTTTALLLLYYCFTTVFLQKQARCSACMLYGARRAKPLCYSFTTALLLLYCFFATALLLLYCCFTTLFFNFFFYNTNRWGAQRACCMGRWTRLRARYRLLDSAPSSASIWW